MFTPLTKLQITNNIEPLIKLSKSNFELRHFEGLNWTDLKNLLHKDLVDKDTTQNNSPTIAQFVQFGEIVNHPNLEFIGYIEYPPGRKGNVQIEGFRIKGKISPNVELILRRELDKYNKADDLRISKDGVYAWWD